MPGKHSRYLLPALAREVNADEPVVIGLAHAPHPALLLEIVDYERHISARSQEFLSNFVLAKRAEMVQDLKSSELAYGQSLRVKARCQLSGYGVCGALEIDMRV
jgi:hypothetical protein